MNKINVITPPDVLHNKALSFLLVQPSAIIRDQFQKLLGGFDGYLNVYFYDPQVQEEQNISWLINISQIVDYIILDIDNMTPVERNFSSYLISLPKTFYLTKDDYTPYNLLSVNRIYDLDWLTDKLKEE